MATPKFATVTRSFHTELKQRVNKYFNEAGKSFTGNAKLLFINTHLAFQTGLVGLILSAMLTLRCYAIINFNCRT